MKISRITAIAAVTAVSAWAAKAVAITIAGGLGKSPLETPLFAIGALGFLTALTTLGWTLASGRPTIVRIMASIGAVVSAIACSMAVLGVVSALVSSDHWAWTELNLWVPAVALLAFVAIRYERPARGNSMQPARS